jgi:hypothetical protein
MTSYQSSQEKLKNYYTNIAVHAASKAKIAALLGQADAKTKVSVALTKPGLVQQTHENFTSAEGSFYYNDTYKNNEALANEIIRSRGLLPGNAKLLSNTKMNDLYKLIQQKVLLFVPHIFFNKILNVNIDSYVSLDLLSRTNNGSVYSIYTAVSKKDNPKFRNAQEISDLYTNGETLIGSYAASSVNPIFKNANLTVWQDIANLLGDFATRTKGKTDPMPNATLMDRLLFLDKVRDTLDSLLQKNKDLDYAKAALIAVDRMKESNEVRIGDLVANKPQEFATNVAVYIFYIAFDEAYHLFNYIGISNNGKILIDKIPEDETQIFQWYPLALFVIQNVEKINAQLFPAPPPSTEKPNVPEDPDDPVDPPKDTVPRIPTEPQVDPEALLRAQQQYAQETQAQLIAANNAALDTLAKASKDSLDSVLENNRAMQADLLRSTEAIAKAQAEEATQRELINAQERLETAKANGATIVEITRLNAEASNDVAVANARAVNDAAERAAEAAVGSVKAVLGENGLPGVLGTISNMLNDSAAQNARLNFEREQTRQLEAELAAQKAARDLQQITEMQFQARQDALERERASSKQIQDLINKVQSLQKTDPSLVSAPYSTIMSKLVANVVITDKQSCRIEANATQSFDFSGENVTADGIVMKQKITVSTSCYQDAQKMINLQDKIKAQIQQFAQALNPDLSSRPPEQWGTNATLDIATNFNTQTMQDMISIANGDQKVSITAKNSILRNLVVDQTVDLYTQIVQNTVTKFDVVKEFAESLDSQIQLKAEEQKRKAADDIAKETIFKKEPANESNDTNWMKYIIALVFILILIIAIYLYYRAKNKKIGGFDEYTLMQRITSKFLH